MGWLKGGHRVIEDRQHNADLAGSIKIMMINEYIIEDGKIECTPYKYLGGRYGLNVRTPFLKRSGVLCFEWAS